MIAGLIRTMRPRQWIKNIVIFAPLVFDVKLFNPRYLAQTVAGFVLLCLVSGNVYIINDLVDIEKDRQHPKKRNRPLPSGQLSVRAAITAAITRPKTPGWQTTFATRTKISSAGISAGSNP